MKPKFLHLDVVFTIINLGLAIVYKEGLEEESYKLFEKYTKIEITEQEQFELATNVLVVNPQTVIMNSAHHRIAQELQRCDINVITVAMSETAKGWRRFSMYNLSFRKGK